MSPSGFAGEYTARACGRALQVRPKGGVGRLRGALGDEGRHYGGEGSGRCGGGW